MAVYTVEQIAERYDAEQGRMYAGAYEWMIKEIQRLTVQPLRTVENAVSKVLHDKTNSKSAKTKAGSALPQPRRTGK